MSLDQIRRIKLLKDLQKGDRHHSKSQVKRKFHSTISMTDNLRKINKNKKYMLEEERNTQIERDNRLLYEKIMGHFQNLKETIQNRNKWRKRKRKVRLISNQESQSYIKNKSQHESQIKFRSRVETLRQSEADEAKTLFMGSAIIDKMMLKIKITLSKKLYKLLARNNEMSIQLQMDTQEYMRLHRGVLGGNPCNIFKYLEIEGDSIRFRQRQETVMPKLKTIL